MIVPPASLPPAVVAALPRQGADGRRLRLDPSQARWTVPGETPGIRAALDPLAPLAALLVSGSRPFGVVHGDIILDPAETAPADAPAPDLAGLLDALRRDHMQLFKDRVRFNVRLGLQDASAVHALPGRPVPDLAGTRAALKRLRSDAPDWWRGVRMLGLTLSFHPDDMTAHELLDAVMDR